MPLPVSGAETLLPRHEPPAQVAGSPTAANVRRCARSVQAPRIHNVARDRGIGQLVQNHGRAHRFHRGTRDFLSSSDRIGPCIRVRPPFGGDSHRQQRAEFAVALDHRFPCLEVLGRERLRGWNLRLPVGDVVLCRDVESGLPERLAVLLSVSPGHLDGDALLPVVGVHILLVVVDCKLTSKCYHYDSK